MPATLVGRSRVGRSDSESSQDSRRHVNFDGNIRARKSVEKFTSNRSGVTRVNLNVSNRPRTPPRRLDNDIDVNKFARRVGSVDEVGFVKPTINDRYVRNADGLNIRKDIESKSYEGREVERNVGDRKSVPNIGPVTPPSERRNHVWNIVNQFDRQSKQKYVCQQSEDDGDSNEPDGGINGDSDMSKGKKNPITNGIKVIFGLKSLRNSNGVERTEIKRDSYDSKSRYPRERSVKAENSKNDRSKVVQEDKKLKMMKTATRNSRQKSAYEDRSYIGSRGLSPDQDVTDGYSTSKTFEYYDSKGDKDYDTIRDCYMNKYKDGRDGWNASPDPNEHRDDGYRRGSASPEEAGCFSTQKTRHANGVSEYVIKSKESVLQARSEDKRKTELERKRDMYKSTGDLEYKSRPIYADSYGGSQPDIQHRRVSPARGYSDDDRSITPAERHSVERSGRYVSTVTEGDENHYYRDGSLEREGSPLARNVWSPDSSRESRMERMRRAPSYDVDSRSGSRNYGTLDSHRRSRKVSGRSMDNLDSRREETSPPRGRRFGSISSLESSDEKMRSWERRAREKGRVQRVYETDEPTYSVIDKKTKVNRKLDYSEDKNVKAVDRGSGGGYRDQLISLKRIDSRKQEGHDTTGRYEKIHKKAVSRQDSKNEDENRYRALVRVDKDGNRDRSSSSEGVQKHVDRSHQKQVVKGDNGFDETIEEERYNDLTMEKVIQDSDTEEVVDVACDSNTEEYEKDGHYHKNYKKSRKETKTSTYNMPDVVQTLRTLSHPVEGNKRISNKSYNEDTYGRKREVELHGKHSRDIGDTKSSIEKSTSENRFREGSRDIIDNQALNRAVIESGTVDRQHMRDGHRDVIVRDHNDYNKRIDNRSTIDDSDPMRKVRTNANVETVDHYRTIDERHVQEKLEKKVPTLEKSRQHLKQLDAPHKPPRSSIKSSEKYRSGNDRDSDVGYHKNGDAVYTKIKKYSKSEKSDRERHWTDGHSSDEDHHDSRRYLDRKIDGSEEDLRRTVRGSTESGRYRDLTQSRQDSANFKKSGHNISSEKKIMTKMYHEPMEANIEKNSTNGWVTRRKETVVARDSSSPSPPIQKRMSTIERSRNKLKTLGSTNDLREKEVHGRKAVSRSTSSVIEEQEQPSFHHYKQYKGRHGPTYPSIRITLAGKENGEMSDGGQKGNRYQRGKLPNSMRNGSTDRLDIPSQNGYHSSTLQHTKKHKIGGMKRSNSTAATLPPVQRLRNTHAGTPLRTKNHTSSSADSVAGESTTSSRRAVGFYIPAASRKSGKSMENLSAKNSTMGVSRTQSVLSSRPGTLKKYSEKTTTYALAQNQGDQVDKEDEIYGSTHVIDYSNGDEEKKKAKNTKEQNKKLNRTMSLPKDTRFLGLFRKKKKDKMRTLKE